MSKEHVLARWIRKRFPNDGTQEKSGSYRLRVLPPLEVPVPA